ncbi:MAG: ATP-binding protein [Atribacterota bacterium]
MFDPLYTTKKEGFGLGMSIVKEIIEMHEGSINIESKKGEGTRVEVVV